MNDKKNDLYFPLIPEFVLKRISRYVRHENWHLEKFTGDHADFHNSHGRKIIDDESGRIYYLYYNHCENEFSLHEQAVTKVSD